MLDTVGPAPERRMPIAKMKHCLERSAYPVNGDNKSWPNPNDSMNVEKSNDTLFVKMLGLLNLYYWVQAVF